MEKNCSKCSAFLDQDAVFCTSCGTPISQTITCSNCKRTNKVDARYCKYCASSLSSASNQSASANATSSPPVIEPSAISSPLIETASPVEISSASTPSTRTKDDPRSWISVSGAVFVLICFLLPWMELRGCNNRVIFTGPEMVSLHWVYLSAPILAVVILAVYLLCRNKRMLYKARPFIIGVSAIAFSLAVYLYSTKGEETKLKSGFAGTVMGFAMAILGCFFMKRPAHNKSNAEFNG